MLILYIYFRFGQSGKLDMNHGIETVKVVIVIAYTFMGLLLQHGCYVDGTRTLTLGKHSS